MAAITDVDEYALLYLTDYRGDPASYVVKRNNHVQPGQAFLESISLQDRYLLYYVAPYKVLYGEPSVSRSVQLYRAKPEDLIRVIDYLISNK